MFQLLLCQDLILALLVESAECVQRSTRPIRPKPIFFTENWLVKDLFRWLASMSHFGYILSQFFFGSDRMGLAEKQRSFGF